MQESWPDRLEPFALSLFAERAALTRTTLADAMTNRGALRPVEPDTPLFDAYLVIADGVLMRLLARRAVALDDAGTYRLAGIPGGEDKAA